MPDACPNCSAESNGRCTECGRRNPVERLQRSATNRSSIARDALIVAIFVIGTCVGSAVLLWLYSRGMLLSAVNIVGVVLVLGSIGLLILVLGAKRKGG